LPPDGILPRAEFTLHPSLAFSFIGMQRYCLALQQRGQPIFAAWCKEWNLGNFAEVTTYIRLGSYHIGHRPTF